METGATVATTTERSVNGRVRDGRRVRPAPAGPDRMSVVLFTLAGFLVVLSLLAWQLGAGKSTHLRPVTTLRRIYETRVITTIVGGSGRGGSSVSQSTSSGGSYSAAAPATTRSS